MKTFFNMLVSRLRGQWRSDDLDQDFAEELEAHLAMAQEEKIRQGLTPEEARRVAMIELGGLSQLKEAGREARRLPWLDSYWLDIKLAVRRLRKSWGLTLIAGLAMMLMIAIGGGVFNLFHVVLGSTVPLEEGDRVVALMTWNAASARRMAVSMNDYERWRDTMKSVEDFGGFIDRRQSISLDGSARSLDPGAGETADVAEISAAAFELARVPALLGRVLLPEDQLADAEPVVVIGHKVWTSRFFSDPAVIGKTIRLGEVAHSVVGVMPEGFAFPVLHSYWTPLRPSLLSGPERAEPQVYTFARLVPGVSLEQAQTELASVGRLPSELPSDGRSSFGAQDPAPGLTPTVIPYTLGFVNIDGMNERALAGVMLFLVTLLLVPPCANIAILVYARTVTRGQEMTARYVLGASRGRIVTQLFLEMLVLAAGATAGAMVLVRFAGGYLQRTIELDGGAPFWIDFRHFSFATVFFSAGLALLAATITGLVPARRATGSLMQSGLRTLGGRTGVQLGVTWTVLIVAQVAFAVAVLPTAASLSWSTLRPGILGPGFAAEEFLVSQLEAKPRQSTEAAQAAERRQGLLDQLTHELRRDNGVSGVTLAAAAAGREPWAQVELEGETSTGAQEPDDSEVSASQSPPNPPFIADFNRVDLAFLDVYGASLLAGRSLRAGDETADINSEDSVRAVVVNQAFAQHVLQGTTEAVSASPGHVLGRRVRYLRKRGEPANQPPGPWFEIVGVVADVPKNTGTRTIYHAADLGRLQPLTLSVRTRPGSNVAGSIRQSAAPLAADWHLGEIRSLAEIYHQNQREDNLPALVLAAVTLSVLLLSAAGMYALMSFTINQRRREVGIRSALGAQPARLLAEIFRRAAAQVALGALTGILVASLLGWFIPVEKLGAQGIPWAIPAAALIMLVVGILSTLGPARRGLKVEPTEALREG